LLLAYLTPCRFEEECTFSETPDSPGPGPPEASEPIRRQDPWPFASIASALAASLCNETGTTLVIGSVRAGDHPSTSPVNFLRPFFTGGGPAGVRANARGGSNPSASACVYPQPKLSPGLYSPGCRQGGFPETSIQPIGCLCVRTGAKGRLARRRHNSTRHLATRLDGYSLEEPTPPAPSIFEPIQPSAHLPRVCCRLNSLRERLRLPWGSLIT